MRKTSGNPASAQAVSTAKRQRLISTSSWLAVGLAVSALTVGLAGPAHAAIAPVAVGDNVTNPVTGVAEKVVEVISSSTVRTDKGNIILRAATVGDIITVPNSTTTYEVTAVTLTSGRVTSVTAKDKAGNSQTFSSVIDKSADINAVPTYGPGSGGSGTTTFTVAPQPGDFNYVNSNVGASGGDGHDGGGVSICFGALGCIEIAYNPSAGGDGAAGQAINDTLTAANLGTQPNYHTNTDKLPGILVSSVGGNGGQGGDAYGNIKAAPGGKAGVGGNVTLTNRVDVVTTGVDAYGIFAQSRAGKGGTGGTGYIASTGGGGGSAAQAGTVTVFNYGNITTTNKGSVGIQAQSLGGAAGGGGDSYGIIGEGGGGSSGGNGGAVTVENYGKIQTLKEGAHGILAQSIGGSGGNGGTSGGLFALGDSGASGGNSGTVSVTNAGTIDTTGAYARGVFAQSVGGGGGSGGFSGGLVAIGGGGSSGGTGGVVSITNNGAITTRGLGSVGLFGQSVGGGGGAGGGSGGLVAIGGQGDSGGDGGKVTVGGSGSVTTTNNDAAAIFAQSVGGGGGSGGFAASGGLFASVAVGGKGAKGGIGGTVDAASTGSLLTTGDRSYGVFAQSVGGGGGNGGFAVAGSIGAFGSVSVGVGGGGGDGGLGGHATANTAGTITTRGENAHGLYVQSVGGGGGTGGYSFAGALSGGVGASISASVAVGGSGGKGGVGGLVDVTNDANIETFGSDAHALFAQSVGGGGGDGGWAGSFAAAGSDGFAGSLSASVGGGGGDGGLSQKVTVNSTGTLTTHKDGSHGLFAQSVGGGGGNGGFAVSGAVSIGAGGAGNLKLSLGGNAGKGGQGGQVDVTSLDDVTTSGAYSDGLLAQSVGGGGGNGGWSGTFGLAASPSVSVDAGASVGGSGGDGGFADLVKVKSAGKINTTGIGSMGLVAQSIGGGGGNGGFSLAGNFAFGSTGVALGVAVGGTGGGGGQGNEVKVDSAANIHTTGDDGLALLAQSVGGGGGNGGWSGALSGAGGSSNAVALNASVGGNGGNGGNAMGVTVDTTGTLWTEGKQAYGLLAQSVGGGGGNGGFALSGSLSGAGTTSVSGGIAVGGCFSISSVCKGGNAGTVTVHTREAVQTGGALSTGLVAQSIGGGGGNGGWVGRINGAFGQSKSAALGLSLGGNGGNGGNGEAVTVTADKWIRTTGDNANGLLAQSVGGGGGNGGFAISGALSGGGKNSLSLAAALGGCLVQQAAYTGGAMPSCAGGTGGTVTVTTKDAISTTGNLSSGLIAQSIGGGGGNGGWAGALAGTLNQDRSVSVGASLGGFGGVGGKAGTVTVFSQGASITTVGDEAYGLLAQSIGGGGGNGGMALSASFGLSKSVNISPSLGGFGGKGGEGGLVTVDNDASIWTKGDSSIGLIAQSVGGGGGNGGNAGDVALGGTESVNVTAAIGGKGGDGNISKKVDVDNSGSILTEGNLAYGLLAQSIGGGGGNGGMAGLDKGFWGEYYTGQGCVSNNCFGDGGGGALSGGFGKKTQSVAISVGGFGGTGGNGGEVVVRNSGALTTKGEDAYVLFAQSVGGGGGNGGVSTSVAAGVGASDSGSYAVTLGGFGGAAGNGKAVTVNNSGVLHAIGAGSAAILAQSVGGGGGTGGDARGFYLQRAQDTKKKSGFELAIAVGGFGGAAGNGDKVVVDNKGDILTEDADGIGIFAQSIGGGGGSGGKASTSGDEINALFEKDAVDDKKKWRVAIGGSGGAAGNGGEVQVTNSATIRTLEGGAHGIFAQSVGGGGGDGGGAGAGLSGRVAIGGFGAAAGDGGKVTVTNNGTIETFGIASHGVFAQSIGGGGGTGGNANFGTLRSAYDDVIKKVRLEGKDAGKKLYEDRFKKEISFAMGGWGGAAGNGGDVRVDNNGTIHVHGDLSYGIYAQSVGGGGGDGGNGYMSGARKFAIGGIGGTSGDGGDIVINNNGSITLDGYGSYGIFAQSIGGGGGKIGDLGLGVEKFSLDSNILAEFALGGGDGGDITINSSGNINITNPGGIAFFAQSVGGSGGLVGGGAYAVMGTLGGNGKGGKVTITYKGNLVAAQTNGIGAVLQSQGGTGNQDIKAEFNGSLIGGDVLGRGLVISGGINNTVRTGGVTAALSGIAIQGDTGNDTIENTGQTFGDIQLGGGTNTFNNRSSATLVTSNTIDLNTGGQLLNEGQMVFGEDPANVSPSPVAAGGGINISARSGAGIAAQSSAASVQPATQVTVLTGNFTQGAGGEMLMDLRFGPGVSDQLNATGKASLAGTITPHLLTLTNGKPLVLVSAAGGVTNNGVVVHDTLAADYSLIFTATTAQLDVTTRFALPGMSPNAQAVGTHLDASVETGGADDLGPTLAYFANLTDRPTYEASFLGMVPEQVLSFQPTLTKASLAMADTVLSCRQPGDAHRVLDEGGCAWARQTHDDLRRDSAADEGFKARSNMSAFGAQWPVSDRLYVGFAYGEDRTDLHSQTYRLLGDINTKTYAFAVKRPMGDTLLAATFNIGFSKLNATRVVNAGSPSVATARDVGAMAWTLRGRAAHVFGGDRLYLKTQADIGVTYDRVGSYVESGAGALGLVTSAAKHSTVWMEPRLEAGARFHGHGLTVAPWAYAGTRLTENAVASFDGRFAGSPAGAAPFKLASRGDESLRTVGVGVDLISDRKITTSIGFEAGDGDRDHNAQGYVKMALRF